MSRHGIVVHHWILAKTVSMFGTVPESNILGVAYEYSVPLDTEFPKERRGAVMLLRVGAHSAGVTEVLIQVHRQLRPNVWELTTSVSDPRPLVFPQDRTVVFATSIRVPHMQLTGEGLYAVTVYFRAISPEESDEDQNEKTVSEWDDSANDEAAGPLPWDPEEPGWVFGAVDSFGCSPFACALARSHNC